MHPFTIAKTPLNMNIMLPNFCSCSLHFIISRFAIRHIVGMGYPHVTSYAGIPWTCLLYIWGIPHLQCHVMYLPIHYLSCFNAIVFLPSDDWSYLDPSMMVPRWDTYVGTTPMLYTNAFHNGVISMFTFIHTLGTLVESYSINK